MVAAEGEANDIRYPAQVTFRPRACRHACLVTVKKKKGGVTPV